MNKVYGFSVTFNAAVLVFIFSAIPLLSLLAREFSIGLLIEPLIYVLPLSLLIRRSWQVLKLETPMVAPDGTLMKCGFYIGGGLLVISSLAIISTIFLIGYLAVNKSGAGAPVGMGIGFALMPFVLGTCLVEMCKKRS